jgi:hypothetical protein
MIISFSHNFIYIKNKKVGGSSLEKYLIDKLVNKKTDIHTGIGSGEYHQNNILIKKDKDSKVPSHMTIRDISSVLKKDLNYLTSNFFIFSVERNPYDKCVSFYNMYKQKYSSFSDYLQRGLLPVDWDRYTFENKIVGKVFKYENYYNVFEELNHYLNLDPSKSLSFDEFQNYNLQSRFRPKNDPYQNYYTNQTRTFVETKFKKEIEAFGYKY